MVRVLRRYDGRKSHVATTLFDADCHLLATEQVWIAVDPDIFPAEATYSFLALVDGESARAAEAGLALRTATARHARILRPPKNCI